MMRAVRNVPLLSNQNPRRARLLVPAGTREARTPVGKCLLCGAEFPDPADYLRHVPHCTHIDDLRELAPSHRNRDSIFGEQYKDPELERHWRGVRENMKREGRTDVRPNEVAEQGQ